MSNGGEPEGVSGAMFWLAVRTLANALASTCAALFSAQTGITASAETTAALGVVVFVAIWQLYALGKRKGWWGLVLVAFLAAPGLFACAGTSGPKPGASQRQEYAVAWFAYTVLRAGTQSYCNLPGNLGTSNCTAALSAIDVVDDVITATKQSVDSGLVSPDVAYSEGRQRIEQATPALEAAQAPTT